MEFENGELDGKSGLFPVSCFTDGETEKPKHWLFKNEMETFLADS